MQEDDKRSVWEDNLEVGSSAMIENKGKIHSERLGAISDYRQNKAI
jgi:hypothetical protein